MGRSVATHRDSVINCYQDVSYMSGDNWDWQDFLCENFSTAEMLMPTMEPCNEWLDDEIRAICENQFAYVAISEYCGLACIALVAKDAMHNATGDDEPDMTGLQSRWFSQVTPKFEKAFVEYNKIGTYSNGKAIYEKREFA